MIYNTSSSAKTNAYNHKLTSHHIDIVSENEYTMFVS